MARSALMTVMVDAVRKAAKGLTRDFGEIASLQVSVKGPGEFAAAAERRVDKILREELQRVRPGYGISGSPSGEVEGADATHRWIVAPLDGAINFLHANPVLAISVALERQGTLVAGLIYNPVTDELYATERGAGAFLNDRRIRVGGRRSLADSLVGVALPGIGIGNHARMLADMGLLANEVAGLSAVGATSLSLAAVAAGRLDGYIERDFKAGAAAAGVLMIREAGGFVADAKGGDSILETRTVIAGNEDVRNKLVDVLKNG
jgi:myo-inositol-1(or 4)-monophosphatase